MDRSTISTPVDVLQAAVNRIVESAQKVDLQLKADGSKQSLKSDKPSFISAARFQGPKPGYVFKKDEQGVGYYRDAVQQLVEDEQPVVKVTKAVDAEELLRQAEEETNAQEIQLLDTKGLRRLINSFERKYNENMELRMKYTDQPEKFMDSEVDLDEQVKSLNQVAGYPELYPVLVESGVVATLLNLLTHENADIAADVIELFMELTDADVLEESEEDGRGLVDAMLEGHALELLVQRLSTLDESNPEEAQGVFNALSVLENMIEVNQQVAELVLERTKLLRWLLQRIKQREFDSNRLYASEILAILMQASEANQRRLGEANSQANQTNGIDLLLQAVAQYKSRDPTLPQEQELLGNLFDVLCSALLLPENKTAFVKAEGVELMILIMGQRRIARFGAIKALDFATTRHPAASERLVDRQGLRYLFSLFMRKAKVKAPKTDKDWETELDERLVSIIYNLFQGIAKGTRRERLAAKFVEQEFQKTDRLLELYFKYQKKVAAAEARLAVEAEDLGLSEEEVMLTRLDEGLFVLQQCAFIAASLWATADPGLRKHLLKLLHQRSQTLANIRETLLELYRSVGDEGGGADEAAREKRRTGRVLAALGVDLAALEAEQQQPPAPGEAPPLPPQLPANGVGNGGHAADVDMDVDMEAEEAGDRTRGGAAAAPALPSAGADGRESPPAPPPAPSGRPMDEEEERRASPRAGEELDRAEWKRSDRDRERRGKDKGRDKDKERDTDRERIRADKADRDKDRERTREHRDHDRERSSKRERRDDGEHDHDRHRHRSRKDDSDGERQPRKRDRRDRSPSP